MIGKLKKGTKEIVDLAVAVSEIDPAIVALYTDMRADVRGKSAAQERAAARRHRRAKRKPRTAVDRIVKWIPVAVCLSLVVCAVIIAYSMTGEVLYGGSCSQWDRLFGAYHYTASTTVENPRDEILTKEEISDFIDDNKEFWILTVSRISDIDSLYLSVLNECHGIVDISKWENRLRSCVYTYVYDKRNGKIWANIVLYRSEFGTVECDIEYRAKENGAYCGFYQAFVEHPGEDMIYVCVSGGKQNNPVYALIARDNTVYLCNSTNTKALQVFDNATDYYSALNTGCNVINSDMFK